MSEPQPWVPLRDRDLLIAVRDILVENPERHNQSTWVGNVFLDQVEDLGEAEAHKVPVGSILPYMQVPLTDQPEDPDAVVPPCGTTGCLFGWAVILSAPDGSSISISNGRVSFPDGTWDTIQNVGSRVLDLAPEAAEFVYSPVRTREELINILNARIDDPEADVWRAARPEA